MPPKKNGAVNNALEMGFFSSTSFVSLGDPYDRKGMPIREARSLSLVFALTRTLTNSHTRLCTRIKQTSCLQQPKESR